MILILTNSYETTSDQVCEWLNYLGKPFIRINHNEVLIEKVHFDLGNNIHELYFDNGLMLELSAITSFWYWRGNFQIKIPKISTKANKLLKKTLQHENRIFLEYIYRYLNCISIKRIGNIFNELGNNKLQQLLLAKQVGLNIPETKVTNFKEDNLVSGEFDTITKPIFNNFEIEYDNNVVLKARVSQFDLDMYKVLGAESYLYLIQRNVKKSHEVRVFYFNKIFYSMAIFSQKNAKTKLDFRNYDNENRNRMIPYDIPKDIKIRLIMLMDKLGFDTGSIDLICNDEGNYVFLEVNHIGKFGWLSYNCNYYLEEKIAQYL